MSKDLDASQFGADPRDGGLLRAALHPMKLIDDATCLWALASKRLSAVLSSRERAAHDVPLGSSALVAGGGARLRRRR
jgi:hypothetical protein